MTYASQIIGGSLTRLLRTRLVIFALVFAAWALPVPAHAADETCANLLAGGTYKTVMRQAFELGVIESPDVQVTLKDLYLSLKDAEWSTPPLTQIRAQLQTERARHFLIEIMSDAELLQFYRNSLHAMYGRIAELWLTQEVRTQVGSVMRFELEQTLGHLLAQQFSPWGLDDRDLTPDGAREHFNSYKWITLPWGNIASFLIAWEEHESFDAHEFGKFWELNGERFKISFDIYQKLNLALNRNQEMQTCCKSEPGCVTCPLNRRWRRSR